MQGTLTWNRLMQSKSWARFDRRSIAMKGAGWRRTRSVLLRGLGIVYLSAFGSLAVQLDGLIGSRGILPAAEYFERAARVLGRDLAAFWQLPSLLWLSASDSALHALCWGGLAASILLIAGVLPGPCLVVLWVFYLSLTVAGQVFLSFQWDVLLLESGLLAVLLTPWGFRLARALDEPWAFAVWLFRWLVFRLMFLSGIVKLTSGDPVWWSWKALDYHYQTQPLPAWTSWYMHQMPSWFGQLSVGVMFYAELVAPFLIFGPKFVRLVGLTSLVLLQLLIAATGNYGFFNVLALVLCVSVLDDRDIESLCALSRRARAPFSWCRLPARVSGAFSWCRLPARVSGPGTGHVRATVESVISARPSGDAAFPDAAGPGSGHVGRGAEAGGDAGLECLATTDAALPRSWSWPRRTAVGLAGGLLVVATAVRTVETIFPSVVVPVPVQVVSEALEAMRSTNSYGLFRVMTTKRPEITVEGSDDGLTWKAYGFRYKPGELDRMPGFTTPHMPRLDWQMWFAALSGDCFSEPWFLRFERRLAEGAPEVLALLEKNPFSGRPPRLIRARLDLYTFTRWGSRNWWARDPVGPYCPPMQ
jgi:hypothetical protein